MADAMISWLFIGGCGYLVVRITRGLLRDERDVREQCHDVVAQATDIARRAAQEEES